jgi:transposase
VVCDNLSSHLVTGMRETIEARGASFNPLPPYSADLNPIERCFAKFEAGLRHIAARRLDDLVQTAATLLNALTPTECGNYIRGVGLYRPGGLKML